MSYLWSWNYVNKLLIIHMKCCNILSLRFRAGRSQYKSIDEQNVFFFAKLLSDSRRTRGKSTALTPVVGKQHFHLACCLLFWNLSDRSPVANNITLVFIQARWAKHWNCGWKTGCLTQHYTLHLDWIWWERHWNSLQKTCEFYSKFLGDETLKLPKWIEKLSIRPRWRKYTTQTMYEIHVQLQCYGPYLPFVLPFWISWLLFNPSGSGIREKATRPAFSGYTKLAKRILVLMISSVRETLSSLIQFWTVHFEPPLSSLVPRRCCSSSAACVWFCSCSWTPLLFWESVDGSRWSAVSITEYLLAASLMFTCSAISVYKRQLIN